MLVQMLCAPQAMGATSIRFAPERDYGPFVFETSDGTVKGLSIDVLEAIKPMLDAPITVQPAGALASILEAAKRGEVDLISSLRPTPERSAFLAFTRPYVQVPAVLVVRQSNASESLDDLAGKRVAVGRGYAVEAFVREAYPQVDWQPVPDDMTGLIGLLQGKYQGVVADIASVTYVARTQSLKDLRVAGAVGFEYPLSFAYRKELTGLGQQLDTALQSLEPKAIQQIKDQWMDAKVLRFEDPKRVVLRWVGLSLAGLAAMLLAWAYLRRNISKPPP
jgi:ABC-type amino acid transport substrate-binding protein